MKKYLANPTTTIVVALLILVVIFAIQFLPERQPEQFPSWSSDSGCVKVQITCCPCSAGGEEVCVPAHNASLYRPINCQLEDFLCIALYNCKIDTCSCSKGECKEVLKEEDDIFSSG